MAKPQVVKIPLGLEPLRRSGLQTYTHLRKLLGQLDRLHKEGADGPRAYTASRILDELEQAAEAMSLPAFEKELNDWIKATRERIQSGQEEFKEWFARELEALLSDKFDLKMRGEYPTYLASYYRIKLDLEKDAVTIAFGADEDPLDQCKADPGQVAKKVNDLQRELEGNLLPDDAFLRRFSEAYDRVGKLRNLDPGEPAPILDVLREFVMSIQSARFLADPRRENYRTYSRVNLAFQLYRLVNKRIGHRAFSLTEASAEEAKRKEAHLWVPDNDRGDGTSYASASFS